MRDVQLREEHAMTQTKLHTSYNKRIDNLETKVTKLEKEKEDTEEDHRQEIAQLLAQQSSALACQQVRKCPGMTLNRRAKLIGKHNL